MVNLAQRNIENGKKGFANASDYFETWDDSDNITAVNAQKDLRHPVKWWHNHLISQYQGSEILLNRLHRRYSNWDMTQINQTLETTE